MMLLQMTMMTADRGLLRDAVLACMAAVCALTDLWCGKVFNAVTVPGLALGTICCISSAGAEGFLGVLCSTAFTVAVLYPFFRAGGLGAGDIKLLAAVSAFMAPEAYLRCFCGAFVIGLAAGLLLLLFTRGKRHKVHFAVPVAASVLLHLARLY